MATFSAVHVDPPVTSEHAWGLAFLRHRMQRGIQAKIGSTVGIYLALIRTSDSSRQLIWN